MRAIISRAILSVCLIFSGILSAPLFAEGLSTASVSVTMTGFKSDSGKVRVALVNEKKSFDSEDAVPFAGEIADIKNGNAACTFKNVPYGEYAVKFFHDVDSSGRLKTGIFGIPKEEYGFSNNSPSKNYDKAKFRVDSPEVKLEIRAR